MDIEDPNCPNQGGDFQSYPRFPKLYTLPSEGLGEIFEGDFADMSAEKYPIVLKRRQVCTDGERGSPSPRAKLYLKCILDIQDVSKKMRLGLN